MFAVRRISVRSTVKPLILLTPPRPAHTREPRRKFVLGLLQLGTRRFAIPGCTVDHPNTMITIATTITPIVMPTRARRLRSSSIRRIKPRRSRNFFGAAGVRGFWGGRSAGLAPGSYRPAGQDRNAGGTVPPPGKTDLAVAKFLQVRSASNASVATGQSGQRLEPLKV